MLAILDYDAGNQTSVRRALEHLGIPSAITSDPEAAGVAEGIIFPGVGAAGQAMGRIASFGLVPILERAVAEGKPIIGVCLGCQIFLEYSEENDTRTLGLAAGSCKRFNPDLRDESGEHIRIPHMGWNTLQRKRDSALLEGISPEAQFYFVHGYYVEPSSDLVIATTQYGMEFCSVYGRDGLWGVQFHPEKSGAPGLKLLSNFYEFCRRKSNA